MNVNKVKKLKTNRKKKKNTKIEERIKINYKLIDE